MPTYHYLYIGYTFHTQQQFYMHEFALRKDFLTNHYSFSFSDAATNSDGNDLLFGGCFSQGEPDPYGY